MVRFSRSFQTSGLLSYLHPGPLSAVAFRDQFFYPLSAFAFRDREKVSIRLPHTLLATLGVARTSVSVLADANLPP
jgi:hypothetical protein